MSREPMSRESNALRAAHEHDDFDFEDRPGIPAPLPPGETLLWQGSPDWKALALGPFHVRKVALWFAAIALFELVWTLAQGGPLGAALPGVAKTLAIGTIGVGLLALLAWLNGRVTIYSITSHRVLIRFGVALQITMNLPFAQVREANVAVGANGIGDIPVALADARRVGYVTLWPHVRPWRLARPEPMLRAVPDAANVAALLGEAMQAHAAGRPAAGVATPLAHDLAAPVTGSNAPIGKPTPVVPGDGAPVIAIGRVASVSP